MLIDFLENSIKRQEAAKNRGKDKQKSTFEYIKAILYNSKAQKACFVAIFIGVSLKSFNRCSVFSQIY